ncbi:MAG TPA: glycosyltransferase family 39 protein [Dehalococcoidia bacterium]|nr:glycosyltransferase family 39 protein [Dehalococcoidia bacterium]
MQVISLPTVALEPLVAGLTLTRRMPLLAAALLLTVLCLPVFTAERSPLNSDQSLYLAEALNIADGNGLTYSTGEPIVHRAPFYPALLAGAFKVQGVSLEAAYLVPRLSIVANVLLVALLGRALFGGWGGMVAGVSAATSFYLRGLGTTLFLDSTQVTFLLASLLLYWHASRGQSAPLIAVAGALLGASFLIKEASLLFLPLPLSMALLFGGASGWKRSQTAWLAGFAVVTGWWWAWVYVQTGEVFLLGSLDGVLGLVAAAAAVMGVIVFGAGLRFAPRSFEAGRGSRLVAGLVILSWNAIFFAGLDAAGWQYESNYLANVPAYVAQILLPNLQPAPLTLAAWIWAAWAMLRARSEAGLLVVGLLLYASFFVLVADRGLSLRDQLPMVYLSYLALGGAAAWLIKTSASFDLGYGVKALGGGGAVAVAASLAIVTLLSGTSVSQAPAVALQDDWDNSLSQQAAAWIGANVEPGASILSSRLYYSHLYFLTGGAYSMHQLPTVEVELNTDPAASTPIRRRSTLFRWENHLMTPDTAGENWLYLTRYPQKGYLIAMAETDLLDSIEDREADYVVVSALDAGFSSPSFNRYFEANAAFELLQTSGATSVDEVRIYRVDRDKLASIPVPAQVTQSAYDYLVARLGAVTKATDFLEEINASGFEVTAQ